MKSLPRFLLMLQASLLAIGMPAAETDAPASKLDEVLATYTEANGGAEALAAIQSIRVVGVSQDDDGTKSSFVLVKKRPHYKMMRMRQDELVSTMAFNGETVWHQVERAQQASFRIVEGTEREDFLSDIDFDGPLLGKPPLSLRYDREARWERIPCHVLSYQRGAQHVEIWIDQRTSREVRNRSVFPDRTVEVRNHDFMQVEGVWMAQRMERFVNDAHVSTIRFDRIDLDHGVFHSFFDPPPQAEAPQP